jgi:cytochrome P450
MMNPVSAATHPDPYPYYAALREHAPFSRDAQMNMWIAASAQAVEEVLSHPYVAVRPPHEPVPHGLVGTSAGDVFSRLVRMSDGSQQQECKRAVMSLLAEFDREEVRAVARQQAARLLSDEAEFRDPTLFAFALPVTVLGRWFGIPDEDLTGLDHVVRDFVRGIGPGATPANMRAASDAVVRLGPLVQPFAGRKFDGVPLDAAIANLIGFLFQSHDATCGLIGNTLLLLGRNADALSACRRDPGTIGAVVREVARLDPSVQNTRRWVTRDVGIAGQYLQAGDAILLLLAAANRDPSLNAAPDTFDISRSPSNSFGFGAGAHACPGEQIALEIASAGVEGLLATGLDPVAPGGLFTYLPSVNARIPVFSTGGAAS